MQDWSEENGRKLDRIILLIEGDGDNAPGLTGRIKTLEGIMYGSQGSSGIQTKTLIMWRVHIWLLCTLSAGAGAVAVELGRRIWKII